MTVVINHHIIITDEEQHMIVNALAFFHQVYQYTSEHRGLIYKKDAAGVGDVYRKEVIDEWQDVADDSDINAFDLLATKIATSK